MLGRLTDQQIDARLATLERMMAAVRPGREAKELPALNATYQRLIDEQVRRDMERSQ